MALNCGIIGITNIGKTTIFNCISNTKAETSSFAFSSSKSNIGIINVPDDRLVALEKIQPTERRIAATVEIIDIPGLAKGSNQGEGIGNKFLADIRNADALIHVLRCFDDDNLPHIDGTVNPVRDKETIDLELQVKDMESVEKKIERMNRVAKTGDKDAKHCIEILQIYKDHFESFQSARTAPVSGEDRKYIFDLNLLSAKPVLYVCNVDEKSSSTGNAYTNSFLDAVKDENAEVLFIAGSLESEIAELDTREERLEFLEYSGLAEPGVNRLVRAAYKLLNLQSFFTIGPKENRAWTIRRGMTAPQAAGVIHSDLERGFIRAEVMKYNDLIRLGSEQNCKEAGKFNVEGKNYIVEDGDVLHIRFNI